MALIGLPADTAVPIRRRGLRYGLAVVLSAALHFTVWHFRGVLEQKPESMPKPAKVIEVSLAAAPKPAPSSKESEPEPRKVEPVSAPPKASAPPKPVVPPRPKSPPKPRPAAIPKPAPPPPPENVAPAKTEAPPAREAEPSAEPITRSSDRQSPPAETQNRSASPGNSGSGRPEESARADYLHNPKPEYPAVAKHRHWEGRVVLRVRVRADGTCGQVDVHQSSGHEVLDSSALEAVREWRFVPAKRNGQPVESWVNVPINFNLE